MHFAQSARPPSNFAGLTPMWSLTSRPTPKTTADIEPTCQPRVRSARTFNAPKPSSPAAANCSRQATHSRQQARRSRLGWARHHIVHHKSTSMCHHRRRRFPAAAGGTLANMPSNPRLCGVSRLAAVHKGWSSESRSSTQPVSSCGHRRLCATCPGRPWARPRSR